MQRNTVYKQVMKKNPGCMSCNKTRNWKPVGNVTLNQVKEKEMNQSVNQADCLYLFGRYLESYRYPLWT